jgi:hypothetical protein
VFIERYAAGVLMLTPARDAFPQLALVNLSADSKTISIAANTSIAGPPALAGFIGLTAQPD